jgi:hypothetical protein
MDGSSETILPVCRKNFPNRATVRPDDVAKALGPLLEVNEDLATDLEANKLGQKDWVKDFGDLILDRTWTRFLEEQIDESRSRFENQRSRVRYRSLKASFR